MTLAVVYVGFLLTLISWDKSTAPELGGVKQQSFSLHLM